MYSTCIFCHSDLGANDSIEHFPIGRRLAFDAARGRLWVVCRRCERWNLTPIEERWEAIEECERSFAATRLRVSTDNIGLARIREGLELVRIGAPQRPEMAAWRYGDQFGRRRRKYVMWNAAGVAAALGIIILGPVTGIIAGSSFSLINLANIANSAYQKRRVRTRIALSDFPDPIAIRANELMRVSIVEADHGWALRVPFRTPVPVSVSSGKGDGSAGLRGLDAGVELSVLLTGDEALRAVGKLLPAMNSTGAKRSEVESAVRLISEVAEPTDLFSRYTTPPAWSRRREFDTPTAGRPFAYLSREVLLALEMATHEDSERRALEGELSLLQDDWRQAEEIAAIADDLFVSDETRARLSSLKRAGDGQ
jgi:hypothetical protein